MRSNRWLIAGILLGLTQFALCAPSALTPEELYERIAPSIWLVETDNGNGQGSVGSAVVIGPAELVTNCHVLEKAQAISVIHEQRRIPARLQHRDPTRDLCQLHVPGLTAPSVLVASASTLRPGARVFAIGNPRGLELTISDGLVSGLRHDRSGNLEYVQISVPISPGSSGGGLFDVYGRLVGITTSGLRESQNLNFALPADWIAELPRRAGDQTVARVAPSGPKSSPTPSISTVPPIAPIPPGAERSPSPEPPPGLVIAAGRRFEYRLIDRLTGQDRAVIYEVDQVDGERVTFNRGSRVEMLNGEVVEITSPAAGELDIAMPPGGWVKAGTSTGATWSIAYRNSFSQVRVGMELRARAVSATVLRIAGREMQTVRVDFDGYTTRGASLEREPTGRYSAIAWYAPEISRVVRFEARSRGGVGGAAFIIDEVVELVAIH